MVLSYGGPYFEITCLFKKLKKERVCVSLARVLSVVLSFKNDFQIGREFGYYEGMVIICPLALFGGCEIGRNAEFLLPLINNKRPPKIEPWWP